MAAPPVDFDDLFSDQNPETQAAAKEIEDWSNTSTRPSRRGRPSITQGRRRRVEQQCMEMMASKCWDEAEPAHLVALYEFCHTKTYEVAPHELDDVAYVQATQAARALVAKCGDVVEAVEFVRWVWTREAARERWRREQGDRNRTYGRIGWRLQFDGKSLYTDWCHDCVVKRRAT